MPGLEKEVASVLHHASNIRKFSGPKAEIPRSPYRIKPEFRGEIVAIHMDVRWKIDVDAESAFANS
jgi:hypothetical protein